MCVKVHILGLDVRVVRTRLLEDEPVADSVCTFLRGAGRGGGVVTHSSAESDIRCTTYQDIAERFERRIANAVDLG